jgi:hypothetical protein
MKTLVLFNYDWDLAGFARNAPAWPHDVAGFDLFSFPSNAHLAWFDMTRFVERLARQAERRGWNAVVSNHEQFGALAAALLAERMGWPGTPVACGAGLPAQATRARSHGTRPAPMPTCGFAPLARALRRPGTRGPVAYPTFVKPVKAAFSVLARTVHSRQELHASHPLWLLGAVGDSPSGRAV